MAPLTGKRKNNASANSEPEWFKKFKDEYFERINEVKEENKIHNQMVIGEIHELKNNIDEVYNMMKELKGFNSQTTQQLVAGDLEMIPLPKVSGDKDRIDAIKNIIKLRFSEVTEERLTELLDILKKNALTSCRSFALPYDELENSNGEKEWKQLSGDEHVGMLKSTLDKSIEEASELEVLYLCRRLWAVEFILQPKWSNLSRNRRNKR
jgi:hypothetical protein